MIRVVIIKHGSVRSEVLQTKSYEGRVFRRDTGLEARLPDKRSEKNQLAREPGRCLLLLLYCTVNI